MVKYWSVSRPRPGRAQPQPFVGHRAALAAISQSDSAEKWKREKEKEKKEEKQKAEEEK